jgi:uncharacterized membrane protein YfcA
MRAKRDRIDEPALREERKPTRTRLRLSARTWWRLLLVAAIYVAGFVVLSVLVRGRVPENLSDLWIGLDPAVVVLAFMFETLDSAAGMGFGTALAPLLFVLGWSPLQVVPALLATEAATGLLAGGLHQEFRNIAMSWRPPNAAARSLFLIVGLGAAGAIASALVAYFAVPLPEKVIKTYVATLVLLMSAVILMHHWIKPHKIYRPRRLSFFAALAGVNKGLGGGGFGPVITLGAVFAGVIEKSATGIATLAEGCVSALAVLAFLAIRAAGAEVDMSLLPSLWLGALPAGVIGPYAVRVLPSRIWRYVIPLYGVAVGTMTLFNVYTGGA